MLGYTIYRKGETRHSLYYAKKFSKYELLRYLTSDAQKFHSEWILNFCSLRKLIHKFELLVLSSFSKVRIA